MLELTPVPSPSWPLSSLSPQHHTAPPVTAQQCSSPHAIDVAPVIDITGVGTCASTSVPLPTCPTPFSPQHCALPSPSTAQVELAPAAIAVAACRPGTGPGSPRS